MKLFEFYPKDYDMSACVLASDLESAKRYLLEKAEKENSVYTKDRLIRMTELEDWAVNIYEVGEVCYGEVS